MEFLFSIFSFLLDAFFLIMFGKDKDGGFSMLGVIFVSLVVISLIIFVTFWLVLA